MSESRKKIAKKGGAKKKNELKKGVKKTVRKTVEKKWRLHLLCWSHMDREWDFPFEITRAGFADLIDDVLTLLEKHQEYRAFHLDGQVVALEDYLELHPEKRARLLKQIRAGRLLIGPWYTLPEMNVLSGECIVRNLLYGRTIGETLGGVMPLGFTNSGWGQISQMPQILQGFGLKVYTSYRGVPVHEIEPECLWEGSDGSTVVLMRPPKAGRAAFFLQLLLPALRFWRRDEYEKLTPQAFPPAVREAETEAAVLAPYFAEQSPNELRLNHVADRLPKLLESLKNDASTAHLWLGNWQDRRRPHPLLLNLVEEVRKHLPPRHEIGVSSLPEYAAAVLRERKNLKVQLRGELRHTRKGEAGSDLFNVLSARSYLKTANRRAEQSLLYEAEPWAAIAAAFGLPYPKALLDHAWKLLLQNQCHDTIGGVGVDRVHEDQMNRFARVMDVTGDIRRRVLTQMIHRIAFKPETFGASALTAFNALTFDRGGIVECSADVPEKAELGAVRITDDQGREVANEVLSQRHVRTKTYAPYDAYQMQSVIRRRLRLKLENVPACGWSSLTVTPCTPAETPPPQRMTADSEGMENEFFRIRFGYDGTFDLFDKRTGAEFKSLHWFEDGGNVGHGWEYKAPESDIRISTRGAPARVRISEHGKLRTTFVVEPALQIPASASADRTCRAPGRLALPIRSEISLEQGAPFVRIRTVVDNRSKDHRLRVLFPSIPGAEFSVAEMPFDVVERPIKLPDTTGWKEPAQGTQPMLNFADVFDERGGLAIFAKGLCEYEVLENTERTLAVTLLRAFAQRHPSWEKGVSPEMHSCQCLGEHVFDYALHPHVGNWESAGLAKTAYEALTPFSLIQHFGGGGELPRQAGFLKFSDDRLLLNALKRPEKGPGFILRLTNPTPKTIAFTMECLRPLCRVALCDMAEKALKALKVSRNQVRLTAGPKKIMTIFFDLVPESDA